MRFHEADPRCQRFTTQPSAIAGQIELDHVEVELHVPRDRELPREDDASAAQSVSAKPTPTRTWSSGK